MADVTSGLLHRELRSRRSSRSRRPDSGYQKNVWSKTAIAATDSDTSAHPPRIAAIGRGNAALSAPE